MTRRLLVAALVLTAFVLAVVELPLGLTYAGRLQDRLLSDVERDARVLAALVEESVESGDVPGIDGVVAGYRSRSGARVVVVGADGRALVDTEPPEPGAAEASGRDFSTRPEFADALAGRGATGTRRSATLGEEVAYAAVPVVAGGRVLGAVRVSYPTDDLRGAVRANWLRLALLALLVLGAAAGLGWLVSRWAIAPVAELEAGAQALAQGDLERRVDVDRGPPELRRLATSFNDMAARLDALVGAQQAFVADASHQLRTPLTALRLRVETLGARLDAGDQEGARADLVATEAELERLSQLVLGLLTLARVEGSAATAVSVDAAAVATATVERWGPLADECGVSLHLDAPAGPLWARAIPGALEQMLDALLDNAVEVAPPGSRVELSVAPTTPGGPVAVSVRDHGRGLPPEELARATDRFWRSADAAPGGTGLGLAIVDGLTAAGGGRLRLESPTDGPGLRAVIELAADPDRTVPRGPGPADPAGARGAS